MNFLTDSFLLSERLLLYATLAGAEAVPNRVKFIDLICLAFS
jgi:hypothetical protein